MVLVGKYRELVVLLRGEKNILLCLLLNDFQSHGIFVKVSIIVFKIQLKRILST